VQPPSYLYGTAWKEDATESCVVAALAAGFRGIDTANQRKHYHEEGVGRGIADWLRSGGTRDQLYLQTKFTFRDGQDHRLPYDEHAPIATQVKQSFASSLVHLGITYLDSLVLHGPSQGGTLGRLDHEAWRAMEALVDSGQVGVIGVSNISTGQLSELLAFARIKPVFVQNRCYARTAWDQMTRRLCAQHGITYQGFSLLTANKQVLANRDVDKICTRHGKTPAQVVFRFAQQLGMLPLTGTTNPMHMRDDLDVAFDLSADELASIEDAG
jgi:diketogulonate reductase-like aldo/keto reductase